MLSLRSLYQRVFARQNPEQILMLGLQKWVQTQPNRGDAEIAILRILKNYHQKSMEIDLSDLSITTLPVELAKLESLNQIKINNDSKPVNNKRLINLKKLFSQSLIKQLVSNSQNSQQDYSLNLTIDQQQELNEFLKEPLQDDIRNAFLRFINEDYYKKISSTQKADISKKLVECLWQIYQRKNDPDFIKNVKIFCEESSTNCESRNYFFIFNLVNFVNIKPKDELNSSTPLQKFEFLKNQALFNYVKKKAKDHIPERYLRGFGEFRESVHTTLFFLEAFNNSFGQQLNLQLLNISSERLDSDSISAVEEFLKSFEPIANAYQLGNYDPINKIICTQLADDYFEGFWGSYLNGLDFIDRKKLDEIIEQQKQIRDNKTEELDFGDSNYQQAIEKIDKDCKLETKKLLTKHFLRVLENLQSPKTLTNQFEEVNGTVYQIAGAFNQLPPPTPFSFHQRQPLQQSQIHHSLQNQYIYRRSEYSIDGSFAYHPQPIPADQPAGIEEVDGTVYQTSEVINQLTPQAPYSLPSQDQQAQIFRPSQYYDSGLVVFTTQPISTYDLRKLSKSQSRLPRIRIRHQGYPYSTTSPMPKSSPTFSRALQSAPSPKYAWV